jgi:hypothetical protein
LLVLDGIRPDVLRAAIRDGDAPNFATLAALGETVWDATSVFPSITPAATAAIATGEPPSGSGIVGHAWYDHEQKRVVVYGAKTETVLSSGPVKVFHNNVWRMNRDDLLAPTIFETLHERGLDGACVNFPIRRGPHEHTLRMKSARAYARRSAFLGASVGGPKEYFMGDLFYSQDFGLHGREGVGGIGRSAGINDEYAAGVGAVLLREKTAPFTLVYFFKGDSITHHHGLAAQREHVATLDRYAAEMFEWAGGAEGILDEYAVLAISDHGHNPLLQSRSRYVRLGRTLDGGAAIGPRARFRNRGRTVAVPNGRAAFLYLSDGMDRGEISSSVLAHRGVDLAMWLEGGWIEVRRLDRELRFRLAAGDGLRDAAGRTWEMEGDPGALEIEASGGKLRFGEYPDALNRLWGCLFSPRCGDVVLSAAPGYTFGEISRGFHAESDHGSLHASDSEVFALAAGFPGKNPMLRSITEVAPTLLAHFGSRKPEPHVA